MFVLSKTVKEFVAERKAEIVESLKGSKPKLSIIQVGDVPASNAYVGGKLKDAAELGVAATLFRIPASCTYDDLVDTVKEASAGADGVIVQLPLPKKSWEKSIALKINPTQDVDGFRLDSWFKPCTPLGIIHYLQANNFNFCGANAVVVGRSDIVGKPMARLLLGMDCTVTVCHSKTPRSQLDKLISNADLLVVAVGKEHFIDSLPEHKDDLVIIDVGINKGADGHLHGDVSPNLVVNQTPVPGGVGLLTRLALMENVVESYEKVGKYDAR